MRVIVVVSSGLSWQGLMLNKWLDVKKSRRGRPLPSTCMMESGRQGTLPPAFSNRMARQRAAVELAPSSRTIRDYAPRTRAAERADPRRLVIASERSNGL